MPQVEVVRNDAISTGQAMSSGAEAFLLSPAPARPTKRASASISVAAAADARKPLLGVCLGHQTIGQHFGGQCGARRPDARQDFPVRPHDGTGLFAGLPSPFIATRYHSLIVEDIPASLIVNATSDDGSVMGFPPRESAQSTASSSTPRASLPSMAMPSWPTSCALQG